MADIRITPASSVMSFTSSLNYVENLTQNASGSLNLYGSGSTGRTELLSIDGNNGRLFTVSDDLSDSLFSVNTVAGLPVIEAFADNTVVMGQYGQNVLVVTGSMVGIGTNTPEQALHIATGSLLFTSQSTNTISVRLSPGGGSSNIDNYLDLFAGGSRRVRMGNNPFDATGYGTGLQVTGRVVLRASALGSAATHILVFDGDPDTTNRGIYTRTPAQLRSDIGAGVGSVTSIATNNGVTGGTITSTGTIGLATAYGDTVNPYASKTANTFLAAPNGSSGTPSFRAIAAADVPTLNQNTTGNASTATSAATLTTARNINGTSFNGSADITTTNWGTTRTITIGSTGKSVNGSGNVSWTVGEIGAATSTHTHDLVRHSLAAPALIDSVSTTNFRTQLFGSTTNGYQLSAARWNNVPSLLTGRVGLYGTMIAWAGSDTHGFLATDYNGTLAAIGGGNADLINWTKNLAFADGTGGVSGTWAIGVSGNAASVTYLPNRTDSAYYQVLWGAAYTNTVGTIAYSCATVAIQSSTGTLVAGALAVNQTSPQGKLHVYQSTNLGGTTGNSLILQTVQNTGGSGGNNVYIKDYALRDATGTTWTTWRHHNSIDIDGSHNTPGTNTKAFYERDPLSGLHEFGQEGTYAVTIDGVNSRIGVATRTPSYPLHVNTSVSSISIYASADIVAYSDESVKGNIRPIENVIERIEQSRGVLYDRTDIESKDNIGFIAQELEVAFPELVITNEDGTKAVKYQNTVAVLFEAIKEQQKQIEELKQIVNAITK